MTALVYSSSLVASFLGGIVALFAPCCIVSLLPTFVGAAFHRGRWRLPATTAEFGAGLAVVLLPIVLGVGALGAVLATYHRLVYLGVGILLAVIAAGVLSGRGWGLPMPSLRVRTRPERFGGVFVLGLVSGVISACCAPVLAGVVAMSALAASTAGALSLGLAYVFGMVFPFFVAALLLWGRGDVRAPKVGWRVQLGGRRILWTDLVAGAMFSVMAALSLYLAATGQSTITPDWLSTWLRWMTALAGALAAAVQGVPAGLQLAGLAVLAGALCAGWALRSGKQPGGEHSGLTRRDGIDHEA